MGLEPPCLLTLRDEIPDLVPGDDSRILAEQALLFGEFLDRHQDEASPLPLAPLDTSVLVHGHCHQRAVGTHASNLGVLARVPGVTVADAPAGCCGMAVHLAVVLRDALRPDG